MNLKAPLVACALALCACSSYDGTVPSPPGLPDLQQPARLQTPGDQLMQPIEQRRAVAVAATDHGLVAFDPATSAVLGQSTTLHQVTDLAYDPWRDRWIAAEYDDDSTTRVTRWKLVLRGPESGRLLLDRILEVGGYSRVIAGRTSSIVFESDGMHERWMVWDATLPGSVSSFQAPIPAGVIERGEGTASRLLAVSSSDDGTGYRASLRSVKVQGGAAGPVIITHLPEWSGTASQIRVAEAGHDSIALAQVRDGMIQVGLMTEDGTAVRETMQIDVHGVESVQDLVVDARRGLAIAAVSGPDRLIAIDLSGGDVLDQQVTAALPTADAPWYSRLIAWDAGRGRLIVAGKQSVEAWDLSSTRTLERALGFTVAGARRPVALSAWRSAPTP